MLYSYRFIFRTHLPCTISLIPFCWNCSTEIPSKKAPVKLNVIPESAKLVFLSITTTSLSSEESTLSLFPKSCLARSESPALGVHNSFVPLKSFIPTAISPLVNVHLRIASLPTVDVTVPAFGETVLHCPEVKASDGV